MLLLFFLSLCPHPLNTLNVINRGGPSFTPPLYPALFYRQQKNTSNYELTCFQSWNFNGYHPSIPNNDKYFLVFISSYFFFLQKTSLGSFNHLIYPLHLRWNVSHFDVNEAELNHLFESIVLVPLKLQQLGGN